MNCETLREALAAEPGRRDDEFERHVADCAPCRRFRQRLLRAESLIGRALRFDVRALDRRPEAAALPAPMSRRMAGISVAAAGILGALTLWGLARGGVELSDEQLAREAVLHWYREPESWVRSDRPVAADALSEVLGGTADIDRSRLAAISFAKSCRIGRAHVPHLVVQGTEGPYMVLLFAGRRLSQAMPLELPAEGLRGDIMPAGPGSIAVLGAASDELEQVEAAVRAAVDWTI